MRIFEIDYAMGIPVQGLTIDDIARATPVGQIDLHPVYMWDNGVHVCAFMKNEQMMSAYVIISSSETSGYHDLVRIDNLQGTKGSITALLVFLHLKFKVRYRIPAHEPLTLQGLRWLQSIIHHGRGFTVTDQNGDPVNPLSLEQEWMHAKNTGQVGQTEIQIPQIRARADVLEGYTGFLAPAIQYVDDDSCVW